MKARFTHKTQRTSEICSFYFLPDRPLDYIAGQFIELTLPPESIAKGGNKRWFTLCSAPDEKELMITTRVPETSPSDFKKALKQLAPDTEVHVSDAMGDFVLPLDTSIPLLFVAAGIGITPYRSMASWLGRHPESRDIHLLYAARSEEEFLFGDDFEAAHIQSVHITGHIDAANIKAAAAWQTNSRIYISGPEPLVETLFKELQELGITESRIHGDYFPGYQQV